FAFRPGRAALEPRPGPAVGAAGNAGGGRGDVLAAVRNAGHGHLSHDRALKEEDHAVTLTAHCGAGFHAGVVRPDLVGRHVGQLREGGDAVRTFGVRWLADDLVVVGARAAATLLLGQ